MSWTRNRVRNNLLRNCALLYVGLLYFTDRSQLECVQHRVFLGCHPRTSMLLNFSDRTRTLTMNLCFQHDMAVDDVDVTFTHKMFFYVNWKIAILKAVTIIESAAIQISRCLIRPSYNCLIHFYKRCVSASCIIRRTFWRG